MIETLEYPQKSDWSLVFQANASWISSVLYSRLRDAHAVEEVLQETALAASKQAGVPNDEVGLCKWLYRVAIRQSLLYRRKQARQQSRIQNVAAVQNSKESESYCDPLRLLVLSEQKELVQAALDTLSNRDYEILILKYHQGMSCREISERIGVSESALKSRLLRARRSLKTRLVKLSDSWDLQ